MKIRGVSEYSGRVKTTTAVLRPTIESSSAWRDRKDQNVGYGEKD